MSECEKMNCGYYWKEEGEDFPCCHFEGWVEIVVKVPKETGDEGYDKREEYTLKVKEKEEKAKASAEAKAKKIERDKKMREEKKRKKEEEKGE